MKSLKSLFFLAQLLFIYSLSYSQTECDFFWSTAPELNPQNEYVASGEINGVKYIYTCSEPIKFSNSIYSHGTFPATQKIPNQRCILNDKASTNVIEFESPVEDPILVFASIGRASIEVPVNFKNEIEVLFEKDLTYKDAHSIKGREGYAVVRIKGVHERIEFEYTAEEYYVNFLFGAGICKEIPCDFVWSSSPEISGNAARGTIGDVSYVYTSSEAVQYTSNIYSYGTFPAEIEIPNQMCIRNDAVTENVLEFSEPIKDPVLVFSSIGRPGQSVPIEFKQDFVVDFEHGIHEASGRRVVGEEGYIVIRFPGVHKKLEFKYTVAEYYANFLFGAGICE